MTEKYTHSRWPDDTEARIRDMRSRGATWSAVGASFGVLGPTAYAKSRSLGMPPSRTIRRFTPDEDAYIRAEWAKHTHLQAIADHLGRDWGTVRQRIHHYLSDLLHSRDPALTRLVRQFGPDAAKAGETPQRAVQNVRDGIVAAKVKTQQAANHSRLIRQKQILAEMHQSIASGTPRNEAIFFARQSGVTLERLGEEFLITRERVRQICENHAFNCALAEAAE